MPRQLDPLDEYSVFTAEEIRNIYDSAEENLRKHLVVMENISGDHEGITSDVRFALPTELANKTPIKHIDPSQLVLLKHSRLHKMCFPSKHWGCGNWWCDEREALGLIWNLKNETNISQRLTSLQKLARTTDHKDLVPSLQFVVDLAAYDAGHPLYALWFAMPIVRGPTVQSLIKKANEEGWHFPTWLVVAIFQQVIEAIVWAHLPTAHKGVMAPIDINPGNIMLDRDSRPLPTSFVSQAGTVERLSGVKLIDFGGSQLLEPPSRRVLRDIKSHDDIFGRFNLYTIPGSKTISLMDSGIRGDNGLLCSLLERLDRTKMDLNSDGDTARDRKRTKRTLNENEPGVHEVRAALYENDVSSTLTRSKQWFMRVQKDQVDDKEVDQWLALCK